ncbi:MAG: CYTH domain-containing protein [Hyphomicrobiaceae bacterium]
MKGAIRSEHLDQVKGHPAIEKRTVGRSRPRNIATVYFDTPDHALRLEGLCLRVRKVGRAYMQCVKQVHNGLGGIQLRMGCEGAVPSQDPAIAARTKNSVG